MKEKTEQEMLFQTAAFCSQAERCESDIRRKISMAGLPDEAAERIIRYLQQENYLSESRYASAFVKDKFRFNKWGRIKINYELQRKRISAEARETALAEIEPAEYRRILTGLLKAKLRTLRSGDARDKRMKLIRFAAGRGFEGEVVYPCVQQFFDGDYDGDDEIGFE